MPKVWERATKLRSDLFGHLILFFPLKEQFIQWLKSIVTQFSLFLFPQRLSNKIMNSLTVEGDSHRNFQEIWFWPTRTFMVTRFTWKEKKTKWNMLTHSQRIGFRLTLECTFFYAGVHLKCVAWHQVLFTSWLTRVGVKVWISRFHY